MSPTRFDVAVVGSGPAGASAALPLAAAGLRVAVIEKAALPRYKTCGGGVLRRAVCSLPIDISPAVERECRRIDLNISPRLRFTESRGRPIVYMTMRDRFDHLLLGAAVARGAIVLVQRTVESVQVESERVRIGTSAGEVEASFVIAADGANSTVARAAGWTEDRLLIPALECEVSVAPDVFAAFAATARFDFDVIPFGYAWSFPKKCHLSMGVLTLRPESANLVD